jgi:hypothetical protein
MICYLNVNWLRAMPQLHNFQKNGQSDIHAGSWKKPRKIQGGAAPAKGRGKRQTTPLQERGSAGRIIEFWEGRPAE